MSASPISSIASSKSSEVSDLASLNSDKREAMENLVLEEPLYYILNGLLETQSGKNLASCVEDLTDEIRAIRALLEVIARRLSSAPAASAAPAH